MGEEHGEVGPDAPDAELVSSIDRNGTYDRYVIADPSCDDRWIGVRCSEALSLRAWQ